MNQERWGKTFNKDFIRCVFYEGILVFGTISFVGNSLFKYFDQDPNFYPENLLQTYVSSICDGFIYGVIIWFFSSKKRKRSGKTVNANQ